MIGALKGNCFLFDYYCTFIVSLPFHSKLIFTELFWLKEKAGEQAWHPEYQPNRGNQHLSPAMTSSLLTMDTSDEK